MEDNWHADYSNASGDGFAWEAPQGDIDQTRVLRGGSWLVNADDARSPGRDRFGSDGRNYNVGFRVLCSGPFDH